MAEHVLFEVGLEELPARFIDDAGAQLKEKTENWLREERINYSRVRSLSTPRRLSVIIEDIADEQNTIEEEVRGPALAIAKDDNGEWTKAAIGFAKGQGKSVEDLKEKEVNGKTYVFVTKRIEGKKTEEILPDFKEIITSISFSNNMRWGTETLRYARPIRWLTAIYGEEIIPFEIAGVHTGNVSYGHRYLGSSFTISNPVEYEAKLQENYCIADPEKRKQLIIEGIRELEEKHDFQVIVEEDLLREVTNLVEYPTVFKGTFEQSFLELPSEVLIISMKEHQRYFPVTSGGDLQPYFIGVRNGDDTALETVIKGNEKVLRARLADAEFFYEEDKKHSIEDYLRKLDRVVFQEKLGTLAEKVTRVEALTEQIGEKLNLTGSLEDAKRAASIGKFDLMTDMVNEFTELQGVMGEIYARHFREKEAVAKAVREQYLPAQASGELPETEAGALLGIAEKVDTIVGIIAVGLTPTGSHDPYGLRRQAAGVLRILKDRKWEITVEEVLEAAFLIYENTPIEKAGDYKETIHEFFRMRALYLVREANIEQDIFEAVMGETIGNFPYSLEKTKLLAEKRHDASFKEKEEALVRILNLADKASSSKVDPERFETKSEKSLFEQFERSFARFHQHNEKYQAEEAFRQLELLAEPIHNFFDNNMVMADDTEIRTNRLALVKSISDLILAFADLSRIEWKQNF